MLFPLRIFRILAASLILSLTSALTTDAQNFGPHKKMMAHDRTNVGHFGKSVASTGSIHVVGAPAEGNATGAAYIFQTGARGTDNWGQLKKLTAPVITYKSGESTSYRVAIVH